MAAIRLKLNGKPLELHPPKPIELQTSSFLDKAPADELFLAPELARKVGVSLTSLSSPAQFEGLFQRYSARIGRLRYWGNPKAIQALLKQVAE